MQTPQTIVIIGTGEKGRGIAMGLTGGNYRVLFCGNEQADASEFVKEIKETSPSFDIESAPCSYEATWEADIIILAVPHEQQESLLEKIRTVANQKIILATGCTRQELQSLLPHSKVIETFNNIEPKAFFAPAEEKNNIECIIKGNDEEALQIASELVSTIGFKPVIIQTQQSFQ